MRPALESRLDSRRLPLRARPGHGRAAERVANYLRTLGLMDRARVRELSQRFASSAASEVPAGNEPGEVAARAVAAVQTSFEAWREKLYTALPPGVDPLWLRAFIEARPELFLGDVERAQRAAQKFGEPLAGRAPRRARFRPQQFELARLPSWFLGLVPPLLLTWMAANALWHTVAAGGWNFLQAAWVGLFAFLFAQAAIGTTMAVIGFFVRPRTTAAPGTASPGAASPGVVTAPVARTALLVPIYHESAEEVFAALAGMRESLAARSEGEGFDIFVLSDSRDPEKCADEERAFRRVASGTGVPLYYHRRAHNERQKAGNLAEFFERWGPRYEYAVILDADSVMSEDTLIELVQRMQASPKVALLQAPLALHRAETLFARSLQFSSTVCGPVFTRGLATWSGPCGNYYGHNAIVRVRAFLDCCALPKLNGEPPFGGYVLSHDFVEAALLCRAGWEVRIAHDIGSGSYEELPPNLPEYVARDHRWCQGNLQHLRVALMHGLRPMSRIHLLLGASAYLAAPAWLAFMALGILQWHETGPGFERVAALVGLATFAILVTPWLLGLVDTLRDAPRRRAHGGALRLTASTLLGLSLGAVLAPVMMLQHTRIVISILMGRAVGWGAQQRRGASTVEKAVQYEWPATVLGVAVALASFFDRTGLWVWLAPLWVPWCLAIPIDLAVSSPSIGAFARRCGLLSVPSELEPEPLLERIDALRTLTHGNAAARFRELVLDPVLVAAHVAKLEGKPATTSPRRLARLRERALARGPASLSAEEWSLLAEDADSIQLLHREAWRRWPVESWNLGREEPQVPPDSRNERLATVGRAHS
jgi:membrane glycosyltransferase